MAQKISVFFIVLVLFFIAGGLFLFLEADILRKNPFLASLFGSKGVVVLSESDLISLKDQIVFLENELEIKKNDLEQVDDLFEENDLLNQKIIELFWEIEALQMAIFEFENNEKEAEEEESDAEEELELEEELSDDTKEKKGVCQPNEININTASSEDLQKIIGVGPSYAQKIISARPFCSLDDLSKVSGIGEKTLQKIKEQGCAFVAVGACASSVPTYFPSGGGGGGGSSASSPQILLVFPQENPVNKEIEVELSVSNLKSGVYDVKISILKISDESEQARTLTEICNEDKTNCESSSYKYLVNAISDEPNFPIKFKLKIIKDIADGFPYEADIIVKIRQNDNQKVVSEFKEKINITEPEEDDEEEDEIIFEVSLESLSFEVPFGGENSESQIVRIINSNIEGEVDYIYPEWVLVEAQDDAFEVSILNASQMGQGYHNEKIEIFYNEKKIKEIPISLKIYLNLLQNPFFNEWEGDIPKNWNKSNRAFQSNFGDGIKGNYALAFDHNFAGPYNDDQEVNFEIEGGTEKIYYGEIRVKGKTPNEADGVRIGILRPGYTTYDYSDWKKIDSEEWIPINHEIIGNKDGNRLGLRIQQKGISGENTNLLIGAAWLGVTEPPEEWPN